MTKSLESNNSHNLPLVIVNPKSAAGSTQSRWTKIAADLATHFGAFRVEFTRSQGDGIRLAQTAAENGTKLIIACGGDGTINEVANGILNSNRAAELGVLPSGTGGDFRRTLGIPSKSADAARVLQAGATKKIDVGHVSYLNDSGEAAARYFLNVSSVGLSASIIERVKTKNKLEWLPNDLLRGKATFALSTLQEVLELNHSTIRISIDDAPEKSLKTILFAVANSRFFGGGMKIAPDAALNDGFFNIINIGDIKTAKILLNAYKLYNGTHLELDEVKFTLAKKIKVSPFEKSELIHIETDGELPGKLPATFQIIPQALTVRVPKT